MLFASFAIGLLACGLVLLTTRSRFRVDDGHAAVLVTFGRAATQGGSERLVVYGPGHHWKRPWQRTRIFSTVERSLDLEAADRAAITGDGTLLRFDASVRYTLDEASIYRQLFAVERPAEHVRDLVLCLLHDELARCRWSPPPATAAGVLPTRPPTDVLLPTQASLMEAVARVRETMARELGIELVAVADLIPPKRLARALDSMKQAERDADDALRRSASECEQRLLWAERGIAIAEHRARAEADGVLRVATFLEELEAHGVLRLYVRQQRAAASHPGSS